MTVRSEDEGRYEGLARLRSRLRTAIWFLRRPRLYPQLVRLLRSRIESPSPLEHSREEAQAWCSARSTSAERGLEALGIESTGFRQLHAVELTEARRRVEASPVKLGGGANLEVLHAVCEHTRALRVVESGVAYGWSSLTILLSLRERPGARLVSVDMPYPRRGGDDLVGIVVPVELRSSWHLIRRADREGLPLAIKEMGVLDVCHYDSDKSYAGRAWAYPLLWQALRTGGLFISDDVGDNMAFARFAERVKSPTVVINSPGGRFVGVILKTAP